MRKKTKTMKAWIAVDAKGNPHLWLEGRWAVYKSTHGKDVSLQRKKNAGNFSLVKCKIII